MSLKRVEGKKLIRSVLNATMRNIVGHVTSSRVNVRVVFIEISLINNCARAQLIIAGDDNGDVEDGNEGRTYITGY